MINLWSVDILYWELITPKLPSRFMINRVGAIWILPVPSYPPRNGIFSHWGIVLIRQAQPPVQSRHHAGITRIPRLSVTNELQNALLIKWSLRKTIDHKMMRKYMSPRRRFQNVTPKNALNNPNLELLPRTGKSNKNKVQTPRNLVPLFVQLWSIYL